VAARIGLAELLRFVSLPDSIEMRKETLVKLCPIAYMGHCVGCPLREICPVKRQLGDYGLYPPEENKTELPPVMVKCKTGSKRPRKGRGLSR